MLMLAASWRRQRTSCSHTCSLPPHGSPGRVCEEGDQVGHELPGRDQAIAVDCVQHACSMPAHRSAWRGGCRGALAGGWPLGHVQRKCEDVLPAVLRNAKQGSAASSSRTSAAEI